METINQATGLTAANNVNAANTANKANKANKSNSKAANTAANVSNKKAPSEKVLSKKELIALLNEEFLSLSALVKNLNSKIADPVFVRYLQASGLKAEKISIQTLLHNLPFVTIDGKKVICGITRLSKSQLEKGVQIKDVAAKCDMDGTYRLKLGSEEVVCKKNGFRPSYIISNGDEKTTYFLRPVKTWSFAAILTKLLKIQESEATTEAKVVKKRAETNKPNGINPQTKKKESKSKKAA